MHLAHSQGFCIVAHSPAQFSACNLTPQCDCVAFQKAASSWNHWLRCIKATGSLQARRNTEAAAAAARKALLAGGDAAAAPGRAGQASVVVTSQGITKSLLRTRQLMAQVRPLPPAALPSRQ